MDRNVILGISGGIAAYKAAELASTLNKEGFNVLPVMTDAAGQFIGAETFRSLTGNQVTTSLWSQEKKIAHISLLEDEPAAIIIAPASADIIGKIANGIADDILSTTVLAAPKIAKIIVPSMNAQMWENPILQQNIEKLKALGSYHFVEPDYGTMACGTTGKGRYPQTEEILKSFYLNASFNGILKGKSVLIVSGGTREPIDEVRVISNLSSGKMGRALYLAAIKQGAKTDFVDASHYSVAELDSIVHEKAADSDILMMPAAVSDFTVEKTEGKISKDELTIKLTKTADILASIKGSFKVGFALEQKNSLIEKAAAKLTTKGLNMIVANPLETLAGDSSNATIITSNNHQIEVAGTKNEVASKIIEIAAAEFESFIYANAVCS